MFYAHSSTVTTRGHLACIGGRLSLETDKLEYIRG